MAEPRPAETVTLQEKKYVSTKEAARLSGYTSDYIGQLARSDKLKSKLLGQRRFVSLEDLRKHLEKTSQGDGSSKPGRPRSGVPKLLEDLEDTKKKQAAAQKAQKIDNANGYFTLLKRADDSPPPKQSHALLDMRPQQARRSKTLVLSAMAVLLLVVVAGDVKKTTAESYNSFLALGDSINDRSVAISEWSWDRVEKLAASFNTATGRTFGQHNFGKKQFVLGARTYSVAPHSFDTLDTLGYLLQSRSREMEVAASVLAFQASSFFENSGYRNRSTTIVGTPRRHSSELTFFEKYLVAFSEPFYRDAARVASAWNAYTDFLANVFDETLLAMDARDKERQAARAAWRERLTFFAVAFERDVETIASVWSAYSGFLDGGLALIEERVSTFGGGEGEEKPRRLAGEPARPAVLTAEADVTFIHYAALLDVSELPSVVTKHARAYARHISSMTLNTKDTANRKAFTRAGTANNLQANALTGFFQTMYEITCRYISLPGCPSPSTDDAPILVETPTTTIITNNVGTTTIIERTTVREFAPLVAPGVTFTDLTRALQNLRNELLPEIEVAKNSPRLSDNTISSIGGATAFTGLSDTPSSLTANRVPYTNSDANALTDSVNLTFDGSSLSVTGTISVSASTTLNGVEYGWPGADGTNSQVLSTDGSGALSWETVASGGSGSFTQIAGAIYNSTTTDQILLGATATTSTAKLEVIGNGYFSGNVGIGTTSPYAKLSVVGPVVAEYFHATSTTATTMLDGGLNVGNGGLVYDNTSGFASVGTTGNAREFTIYDVGGNSNVFLQIADSVTGTGVNDGLLLGKSASTFFLYTPENMPIHIGANSNTNTLVLDPNGNASFGGIPSPIAQLEVLGSFAVSNGASGDGNIFKISSNDRVGINDNDSDAMLEISASGGSEDLFMLSSDDANDGDLFIVKNSGNVGIGTTSPYSKFAITGTSGQTNPLFEVASSTETPVFTIRSGGDLVTSNQADTITRVGVGVGDPSGVNNNLFGYNTGNALTTGHSNVAIGATALLNGTITERNIAIGFETLESFTGSGGEQVAIGYRTLNTTVTGTKNTAVGSGALFTTTGSNNTALGYSALVNTGSASNNIAIGYQAGDNMTSGSNNIFIGYDIDATDSTGSNQLNIGNIIFSEGIDGTGTTLSSGNVGIGTTSPWKKLSVNGGAAFTGLSNDGTGYYVCLNTTSYELATSTTACGASSEQFKENIEGLSYGLDEVLALEPVFFTWKDDFMNDDSRQLGLIAEDVASTIPEVIGYDSDGNIMNLDYPKLTAVLINAIKELHAKVSEVFAYFSRLAGWFDVSDDLLCVDDVCVTKEEFKDILREHGTVVSAQDTLNESGDDSSGETLNESGDDSSGETLNESEDSSSDEAGTTTPNQSDNTSDDTGHTSDTTDDSTVAGTSTLDISDQETSNNNQTNSNDQDTNNEPSDEVITSTPDTIEEPTPEELVVEESLKEEEVVVEEAQTEVEPALSEEDNIEPEPEETPSE